MNIWTERLRPVVRRGEWLELVSRGEPLDEAEWKRLLTEELQFPLKLLGRLISTGGVRYEGKRLRLKLFPEEVAEVQGEWTELAVLYEDDFCLAVLKPAGMPVHPAYPGHTGTLAQAVASYYETTGQVCRIRHIHRLDEDTTGPVLYAKNEFAHIVLDAAMREKAIARTYLALVQGKPRPPEGTVDRPIGKDRSHPNRRRVSPGGDPARTRYRTLEPAPEATLVELQLETGRTHQIRVHMSDMGCPLVGDALYGGSTRLLGRQALHGASLEFPHPWTGERIRVEAEPPADFRDCWKRLLSGSRP
ncbi:RluA family pseudouridine synthase [Gorillibacterium sp. sgz5001074]|uniref:RluA family pseudouridine synthase n=1 Tax=Gorillibacterium sp. sgz5001074 TaxID=3446695 RepID=UPI003F6776FC